MTAIILIALLIALAFGVRSFLDQSSNTSSSTAKSGDGRQTLNRMIFIVGAVILVVLAFRFIPWVLVIRGLLYIAILLGPYWLVNRLISQRRTTSNHHHYYREQRRTRPQQSRPKIKSPYEVLKVEPTATRKEITQAYRRMVKMYHPDKVAELAPEFKELAEERMKTINAAYEELTRN